MQRSAISSAIIIAFFLLFSAYYACGQVRLLGQVIDASSGDPIGFANIGIKGKSIGTVADEQGRFCLELSNVFRKSKVVVSSIGYISGESTLQSLLSRHSETLIIALKPTVYEINDITVQKKKLYNKRIGNYTKTTKISAGYQDNILGCEVAVKFKVNSNEQILLKRFNFSIANSECDSLVFRVNVYEDDGGLPGKIINKKEMLVTTTNRHGVVSVNLSDHEIWRKDNFFVGLEWIKNTCPNKSNSDFTFSARFFKKLYYKPASAAEWRVLSMIGLGFWVDVLYCDRE